MCLALGHAVEPATTVQSCAGFCMSKEVCHELGKLFVASPQCCGVHLTANGRSHGNHLSGLASDRVGVPLSIRAWSCSGRIPRPARRIPSDPWISCGAYVPLTRVLSCRMVTTVDE